MKYLFLFILSIKGFKFTDISIVAIPVILGLSVFITYKVSWKTPFKAVTNLTSLAICVIGMFFLDARLGWLVSAGVLLGILAKIFFPPKKITEP